jgi:hypothetical protein
MTLLFLSLIPGSIGLVLFVYGKKQQRWPHLVSGLLLMVYPYFTSTVTSFLVTGGLIMAAFWYAIQAGW